MAELKCVDTLLSNCYHYLAILDIGMMPKLDEAQKTNFAFSERSLLTSQRHFQTFKYEISVKTKLNIRGCLGYSREGRKANN